MGLLRQSVFGRLAGYEDVNDAARLARDLVMRQIIGGRAVDGQAASSSQMGRFRDRVARDCCQPGRIGRRYARSMDRRSA